MVLHSSEFRLRLDEIIKHIGGQEPEGMGDEGTVLVIGGGRSGAEYVHHSFFQSEIYPYTFDYAIVSAQDWRITGEGLFTYMKIQRHSLPQDSHFQMSSQRAGTTFFFESCPGACA